MHKKLTVLMLSLGLLAAMLGSCTPAQDDTINEPAGITEAYAALAAAAPPVSALDKNIAEYETLVLESGTAENYRTLAGYYAEAGMVRRQRDALERCWRLNQDTESFDTLQTLVVNAEEENSLILSQLGQLLKHLAAPASHPQAVALVAQPDWFTTMMPKLWEGHRSYYLEDAEDGTLVLEAGYGDSGPYVSAWLTGAEDGQGTYLRHEGNAVQLLTAGLADGQYDGTFTSWLCVGDTGTLYKDSGTFKKGVLVGDFTSETHSTQTPTDPAELFAAREEAELLPYTGNFGDDGVTTMTPPLGLQAGWIAYAYSASGSEYLYYTPAEGTDTQGYVFDSTFLGLAAYPQVTLYTPVVEKAPQGEVLVDLAQVQLRINDSVIEWFDGTTWHAMGDVQEYLAQDPFHGLGSGDAAEEDADAGQSPWFARRGTASVARPAASGYTPSRTGTGTTPTPAATPGTDSGGGGGGGGDGGGGSPPPAPEPPPDTGNDGEDIWSGDIF